MFWVAIIFGAAGVLTEWAIRRQDRNQQHPPGRVSRRCLDNVNRTNPHGR